MQFRAKDVLSWIKATLGQTGTVQIVRVWRGDPLIRAASLLLGLPVLAIGLFAANISGGLNLVETLLGILAIISFAVIATGWTIDHDV